MGLTCQVFATSGNPLVRRQPAAQRRGVRATGAGLPAEGGRVLLSTAQLAIAAGTERWLGQAMVSL
jgi:hypothetical protein